MAFHEQYGDDDFNLPIVVSSDDEKSKRTLSQLNEELCRNRQLTFVSKPLQQNADKQLDQLTRDQNVENSIPCHSGGKKAGADLSSVLSSWGKGHEMR